MGKHTEKGTHAKKGHEAMKIRQDHEVCFERINAKKQTKNKDKQSGDKKVRTNQKEAKKKMRQTI